MAVPRFPLLRALRLAPFPLGQGLPASPAGAGGPGSPPS